MKESRSEEQFGQLVVILGFASPVIVSECIKVQKALSEKGEKKPLGQILVEKGALSVEQVRQVLLRQGMTLIFCKSCKSKFNLADPYSGDLFKCRICGAPVVVVETPEELEEEKKTDLLTGTTLAGCRLDEQIGEDSVTRSYKAWQPAQQRDVVMRILKEEFSKDKDLIKLFLKEAATASKVHHSSLPPIYDVGQAEGYFYICHAYVEGETLRQLMEREGRPPVRRAVANILHITSGMALAHKSGVIHKDIRPGNIIYSQKKNRPLLNGLGFIKRPSECSKFGESGVLFNPPGFMAPEQMKAYSSADARSDVFSLCAVLFYMLVGEPPFKGDDPIEVLAANLEGRRPRIGDITDGLPKELCDLIDKGLSRHPDQRYADAEELRLALERVMQLPLPSQSVKVLPRSHAMESIPDELAVEEEKEPEEKEYKLEDRELELMPPHPQHQEEELRLADEEPKPVPKKDSPTKQMESQSAALSEEEKARIIEEIEKPPEKPLSPVKTGEPIEPETPEVPASPLAQIRKIAKEKPAVLVLSSVGFILLIIIILVVAFSGSEPIEKEGGNKKSESELAFRDLESFVNTNKDTPERYEEILNRCKEYVKQYPASESARKVGYWITEYEKKNKEEHIRKEWDAISELVKSAETDASKIEEAIKGLEEFARNNQQHPLSSEAKKAAENLTQKRLNIKAENFLTELHQRVKELISNKKYAEALALVERGMPPEFEQRKYGSRLREIRDETITDAEKSFEQIKIRAKELTKEWKIDEAIKELSSAESFGIKSLTQSVQKEITAIRDEVARKLWLRRLLVQSALQEAYTKASEGDYAGAEAVITESLKDNIIKENFGPSLENMITYIDAARKFSTAHIDYLKKQVGSKMELRTEKGILLEGELKKIDDNELQIGENPPIPLSDIPYDKKCEFARLALGGSTTEAIMAEASFKYFRGEVADAYALVADKKDDKLIAFSRVLLLAQFMDRVTRNRIIFNGIDTKFFKPTNSKLTVKELEGEPEKVLLCEKEGVVSFKEAVLKDYILRFSFRLLKGAAVFGIKLPYDSKNSVTLELYIGETALKIKEADAAKSAKVLIHPEVWYEVEARFIGGTYTVLIDGKTVLEVTQRPLFTEADKESLLGFVVPHEGCILKNIQLLEAQ